MKRIAALLAAILLLTGCGCSAPEPVKGTKRSSASSEGTTETTAPAAEQNDSTAAAQGSETTVLTETERTTAAADRTETGARTQTAGQSTSADTRRTEAQNTTAAGKNQTTTSIVSSNNTTNTTSKTTTSKTTTSKTTTTTTKKNNSSEPEIDGYKLSEVLTGKYAFGTFAYDLAYNLGNTSDSMVLFGKVRFSYGYSSGLYERYVLFLLLNSSFLDSFDDAIIKKVLFVSGTSDVNGIEMLERSKELCSKFKYITTTLGTSVDFTKYTLDYELGNVLNNIVNSYNKGTLSQLIFPSKYENNPAVKTLLYSYGVYKNEDYMDSFLNELSLFLYSKPFTQ